MRALVLDFDGVIFDSARESFRVALEAYLSLEPGSALAQRDREELGCGFLAHMPLGNRAEDYGTVLAALEQEIPLDDQTAYDRFRAGRGEAWTARYHARFYEVRRMLATERPAEWLARMPPYEPFVRLLRARAAEQPYAIATAKDRESVDALLDAHGLGDLFPARLILDKETGTHKEAHLRCIRELVGVPFADLTFVDDKVNHLDRVAPLGVRCVLAAWGYNGPREHELARCRGYAVSTLAQAERTLWGST